MKVNGLAIREAIKIKKMELSTVLSTFEESLFAFEGETKKSPIEITKQVYDLELQVTSLQTIQSIYNSKVIVKMGDVEVPLEQAVKLIGGVGRLGKAWRVAAKGKTSSRYSSGVSTTRSKDTEVAKPTVTKEEAVKEAKHYEKLAAQLRSIIAKGNLTDYEIDDTDAKLFE